MAKAKPKMRVVYSASRKLYPYMLPTITSLLEHNKPEKVYLMIEDDHLPYDVPEVCEIVNVGKLQHEIFPDTGASSRHVMTKMCLMRAYYCSLFPEADRIIQLDIDTIVCDSLKPLWDMDLDGYYMAACPEYKGVYHPYGEPYFNIGVAVFNLAEMRKDGIEKKLIDLLNTEFFICAEQDAWNKLAKDKIKQLEVRWNEAVMIGQTDNPAVVHFAGYGAWWVPMVMQGYEKLKPYRHLFREDLKDVYG